jgi:hypothetical protein
MIINLEGIDLECHFDYTPPEPENGIPERVDLIGAYVGDVDISPLLSFELIDELEARCLSHS